MIGEVFLTFSAQLSLGCAVLACLSAEVLRPLSRSTKLAIVVFTGVVATTLFMLLLLCLGAPWDPRWCYALGALGATTVVLRIRHFRSNALSAPSQQVSPLRCAPPLPWFWILGFTALAGWMIASSFCLPSVDYDSLAIWSYRVRVLLREGSLYTESLRDPLRIAPMPRHPYFLPTLEALSCGRGTFAHWATHVPHVLLYLVYALLSFGAAREFYRGQARVLVLALMLCMPAPAVQWWLEGAREPAIGVAALWATYWLIRWLEQPLLSHIFLTALGVAAMYHAKIEGAVFGAALTGSFWLAAAFFPPRRIRLRHAATLALAVALAAMPWLISKALIPATTQDYDFSEGMTSHWTGRTGPFARVLAMACAEVFLRPELYAFSPHVAAILVAVGTTRRTMRHALVVFLAPLVCLLGILAIYTVRQEQLGPERNVTFSRRFVCFVPAAVFAAAYLSALRRRFEDDAVLCLTDPEASAEREASRPVPSQR